MARSPETVKAKKECDDHKFTVVSQAVADSRCVV